MQTPFAFAEADLQNRPVNENRPSNDDLKQAQFIAKSCKAEYQKSLPPPYSSLSKVAKKLEETGQEYLLSEAEAEVYAKRSADLANCLIKTTEKNQNLYLKNAEININITGVDDNYDTLIEFQGAVPLWTDKNENKALFLHPGFVLSINSETKSHIDKNFGLVYRFTVSRGVIGVNVFYDQSDITEKFDGEKSKFTHRRGSVGLDYQSGQNYLATNYYFPITGWVDINEYYREHVLGGIDLIFKRLISKKLSLKLSLAYWDYSEKRDHINSTVGLGYQLSCNKTIRTDLEYDPAIKDVRSFVRFVFTFGGPKKDPDTCLTKNLKESPDIWKLVERKRELVYERVKKIVRLIIPDQVTPRNISYSYTLSNSNFQSLPIGQTANVLVSEKPDWLTYDFESKTFSGIPTEIGIYRVAGTVSLNNNNKGGSSWSFHITAAAVVEATPVDPPNEEAPTLTIADQTIKEGQSFSYEIKDSEITNLRDGETATIRVTSSNPAVSYDAQTKILSSGPLNDIGTYIVTGTISDEAGNSRTWEFTLIVRDNTAPTLTIADQTIKEGQSFSYEIKDSEITNLRSGETAIIRVTSSNPAVSYDAQTKILSSGPLNVIGMYEVMGTISDGAGNPSDWEFTLIVRDNTAPTLTIADQTININEGQSFSYEIKDSEITNLRDGETAIIRVTSSNPAISYDDKTRTLSSGPLNVIGMYEVMGTISDGAGNSDPWSFTLTVQEDDAIPMLNIADQTINEGQSFSYKIKPTDITGVRRATEVPTIILTSSTPAIDIGYHASSETFFTSALNTPGVYTISGTITNKGITKPWSFSLTVEDVLGEVTPAKDKTPRLNIAEQTMTVGDDFSYVIQPTDITGLEEGETLTILTEVRHELDLKYNANTRTFSFDGSRSKAGRYQVSGNISDGTSINIWTFFITILAVHPTSTNTPRLNIAEQTVLEGDSFSYTIKDSDITGMGNNENFIINFKSSSMGGLRGLTYNANTRTFSFSPIFSINPVPPGRYQVSGTISNSDGTSPSDWTFFITILKGNLPPRLTIPKQTIIGTGAFSYVIQPTDITGLEEGETLTIKTLETSFSLGRLEYDSAARTIHYTNKFLVSESGEDHHITGTISDGTTTNEWRMNIRVLRMDPGPGVIPKLTIAKQTIIGTGDFSYTIQDSDITGVDDDETLTIKITDTTILHLLRYDSATRTIHYQNRLGVNEKTGNYIQGTISDGTYTSTWRMDIAILLMAPGPNIAPKLTIPKQTITGTGAFSYKIQDGDITGVAIDERRIIKITGSSLHDPRYDSATRTIRYRNEFLVSESGEDHHITGTISDGTYTSTWRMDIRVLPRPNLPPRLTIPKQTITGMGDFSYKIKDDDITGLEEGETLTIKTRGTSLHNPKYNSATRTIRYQNNYPDISERGEDHHISGTISDGTTTNEWRMKIRVLPN